MLRKSPFSSSFFRCALASVRNGSTEGMASPPSGKSPAGERQESDGVCSLARRHSCLAVGRRGSRRRCISCGIISNCVGKPSRVLPCPPTLMPCYRQAGISEGSWRNQSQYECAPSRRPGLCFFLSRRERRRMLSLEHRHQSPPLRNIST